MAFSRDTKFTSPEPIISRLKEELRSYFNTGQVDELMLNEYVHDCLFDEFKSTYLPIRPAVIDIFNYQAELPCDFKLVREVWICACGSRGPILRPNTFYYQTDCRINPTWETKCDNCDNEPLCGYQPQQPVNLPSVCDTHPMDSNNCMCASGDQFRVTHKVQSIANEFTFTIEGMLTPGDYKTVNSIWEHSPNRQCSSYDTFNIRDNHIVTSFRTGTLYLSYYADPIESEDGYYQIPDSDIFKKYLLWYLKAKVFETLFYEATDENFNQVKAKKEDAEAHMYMWLVKAKNEAMGRSIYDVKKAIVRSYNKLNRFRIR